MPCTRLPKSVSDTTCLLQALSRRSEKAHEPFSGTCTFSIFQNCRKAASIAEQMSQQPVKEAGDVILSEGNLLVLYYAPNTWNFTRLGRVRNLSEAELRAVLGKGDITATLTLSDEDDIDISAHSGKI